MFKKAVITSGVLIIVGVLSLGMTSSLNSNFANDNSEVPDQAFWDFFFRLDPPQDQENNGNLPPQGKPSGLSGEMGENIGNRPPKQGQQLQGQSQLPQGKENMDQSELGEGHNIQGRPGTGISISLDDKASQVKSTTVNNVSDLHYAIVDTNQIIAFDEVGYAVDPSYGNELYGQDANYSGYQSSYRDNGDGTVSDLVTDLMWQQDPGVKMTYAEAVEAADNLTLGGYDDWRLPSIKELYSLIQFSGTDPSIENTDSLNLIPFIDTDYFVFEYGDTDNGERIIDSQFASSTKYVGTTMNGDETMFGVNFADGRIKGYGLNSPRTGEDKEFFVLFVRGNSEYGENEFIDNGDGTITDLATGLMWLETDSVEGMNWQASLQWSEELEYADYSDWRLPDAKELQSIVDYTRSPSTTNSAAIDPIFNISMIEDEGGSDNYPFFWTSTTHQSNGRGGSAGVYIAFGEALGFMSDKRTGDVNLMDVHGAGAQRSDPKMGDADAFETGRGPQGDVVRIENYVRAVRTVEIEN